jgi:hypothetical protein
MEHPPGGRPRWPLFVVCPAAAIFFWSAYLFALRPLSRKLAPEWYARLSRNDFNERCWRQNLLSALHTFLSICLLSGALIEDRGLIFGGARLYPHGGALLYLDISMSLGYFSFALPTSIVMSRAGFPFGSRVMVLHHTLVFAAQSTFLLTQYPSGYMAASGFLFELTNIVFIPHLLLLQLEAAAALRHALGMLLVVVFTLARCVACTALAVASWSDLASFAPPARECWLFVALGLGCFYGLLAISWYWYATSILPSLHDGLQSALGATYYQACCPEGVRRWAWRRLSRDGREEAEREDEERADRRRLVAALQELRAEMEMDAAAASPAAEGEPC